MMKAKRFGLVLLLMSVTACVPVVYDAAYYEYRTPASHVSVQSSYVYASHRKVAHQVIHPIELTLYADSSYLGLYFQPIHLVIADGGYVEIPVRNRRGRHTTIFAHYHQRDLHFDSSRNCQRIHGSSGFKYDKRWDKGHKYAHINAGKDYDLTGLRLQVRNAPAGKRHLKMSAPVKVIKKQVVVRKVPVKQQVAKVKPKRIPKKMIVREEHRPSYRHTVKSSETTIIKKRTHRSKALKSKDNSTTRIDRKVVKTTSKPHIVQRVVTAIKLQRASEKPLRPAVKRSVTVRKSQNKQVKTVVKQKSRIINEAGRTERAAKIKKTRRAVTKTQQKVVRTKKQHQNKKTVVSRVVRSKGTKVNLAVDAEASEGKQGKLNESNASLKDGESGNVRNLVAKIRSR